MFTVSQVVPFIVNLAEDSGLLALLKKERTQGFMTMVWIVLTTYFVHTKHDCVLSLKKPLNFANIKVSVTNYCLSVSVVNH